MRLHRALRHAGGAGGEAKHGDVGGLGLVLVERCLQHRVVDLAPLLSELAVRAHRLDPQALELRLRAGEPLLVGDLLAPPRELWVARVDGEAMAVVVEDDDVLEALRVARAQDLEYLRHVRAAAEDGGGLGELDLVLGRLSAEGVVERQHGDVGHVARLLRDHPLGAVLGVERHLAQRAAQRVAGLGGVLGVERREVGAAA